MTERQLDDVLRRFLRSAISHLPSESLLSLRRARDFVYRAPVHEPEFELLRHFDRPGVVIADVGANRGQSVRSLRAVLTDPEIHAIEPNPVLATVLRRGFTGSNVRVYDVGLADFRGEVELFLPRYGHTVYDTRASMSACSAASFLSEEFFWRFRSSRSSVERRVVRVRPLDDLGLRPEIVKIDVEGAVKEVLSGATETLRSARPLLLVEDPCPDSVQLLDELGYRPGRFSRNQVDVGRIGKPNTFFLLAEHLELLHDLGIVVEPSTGIS